jgi:hypothetical protein
LEPVRRHACDLAVRRRKLHLRVLGLTLSAFLCYACGDDESTSVKRDAGSGTGSEADTEAAADASMADVAQDRVAMPLSHEDLMNACTDAEKIDKQQDLPLLLDDGGLPPLP